MCGIVGYIGTEQAAPILLEGLSKLEYRGYDSAGLAVYSSGEEKLNIYKAQGRLQALDRPRDVGLVAPQGVGGLGKAPVFGGIVKNPVAVIAGIHGLHHILLI